MQNYITLRQAAKLSPGNRNYSTVWRWCRRGVKALSGQAVRLEHRRIGGQIFTTKKALDEFLAALSQADTAYFSNEQVTV